MISEAIKELFKKLKQEDPKSFGLYNADDFEISYFENEDALIVSAVEWVAYEPDIRQDLGTLDEMLKKYEIKVPNEVVFKREEGGITDKSMKQIIDSNNV